MTEERGAAVSDATEPSKGPLARLASAGLASTRSIASFVAVHWRGAIMFATIPPAVVYLVYLIVSGMIFWDFRVYQTGIAAYQAIGTPYDPQYLLETYNQKFAFTSPPIIVLLLSHLSWLITSPAGLGILLALHLAAWFFIPYLLLPREDRPPSKEAGWMLGAFLFALGFPGTKMFGSGNATGIIMWACIGTLLFCMRRKNYLPFWIVLILACQMKFLFIVLAIVPFLLDRKIWQPAVVALIVAAIYSSNYLIAPDLAQGFAQTMQSIATDPTYVGQAVMGAVQAFLRESDFVGKPLLAPVALAVHGVYALIVLGFAASVMWSRARPRDNHMAFLFALAAAMLASPRIIDNDFAVLIIPYIVFFRSLLLGRGPGLFVAGAALVFSVSLTRTPLDDWGGLIAIAGAWLGIGLDWILKERPLAADRARAG